MNKSLVLAIGVLVLIALGVWFFTSSSPSQVPVTSVDTSAATTTATISPSPTPVKATATSPSKGVPNSTTLKSLLTQTGSYECDYSTVQASGQTSNVIYIYDGKMRGEFRTTANGSTNSNLFVYDGHYMYQWKEGTSVGTRTVLTSLAQLPLVIPKDLTSGSIIGNSYTSVGWICHTWLTNKSLLAPPSYVSFG